jgi:hypothetical protein
MKNEDVEGFSGKPKPFMPSFLHVDRLTSALVMRTEVLGAKPKPLHCFISSCDRRDKRFLQALP